MIIAFAILFIASGLLLTLCRAAARADSIFPGALPFPGADCPTQRTTPRPGSLNPTYER